MKITLYANALSPHNADALKELLEKQLSENEAQIKCLYNSDQQAIDLYYRCTDLIAAIYTIERSLNSL